MKERPILFSVPMVRAILEGRKTQTRRIIKDVDGRFHLDQKRGAALRAGYAWFTDNPEFPGNVLSRSRHGGTGDRLWVRETWAAISPDEWGRPLRECNIEYRADTNAEAPGDWDSVDRDERPEYARWKPSIHMPRWASRILLEITDICVERLQSISEEDAKAEGMHRIQIGSGYPDRYSPTPVSWQGVIEQQQQSYETPILAFDALWKLINGPDSWSLNPWVWVISFRRIAQQKDIAA